VQRQTAVTFTSYAGTKLILLVDRGTRVERQFSYPVYLTPLLTGLLFKFFNDDWLEKLEWCSYQTIKNFMHSLDTAPQRDGRADKNSISISCFARYCMLTRDKNPFWKSRRNSLSFCRQNRAFSWDVWRDFGCRSSRSVLEATALIRGSTRSSTVVLQQVVCLLRGGSIIGYHSTGLRSEYIFFSQSGLLMRPRRAGIWAVLSGNCQNTYPICLVYGSQKKNNNIIASNSTGTYSSKRPIFVRHWRARAF